MSRLAGWTAITVALFALVPSYVPGAISLFGLMFSLVALALSIFSIKKSGEKYFQATGIIVIGNVLLINDALRVWEPIPMPLYIKLSLYGAVLVVVIICALIAYRLKHGQRQT
jgi:hypothetical protein